MQLISLCTQAMGRYPGADEQRTASSQAGARQEWLEAAPGQLQG